MASLLLLRHAQASFGTDCYDRLSELGVRQAQLAGNYLAKRGESVARILCGQLVRQRATAMEIALRLQTSDGHTPRVEIDSRLDELDVHRQIERIVPRLEDPSGALAAHVKSIGHSRRAYHEVIRSVFIHWQGLAEEPDMESWPAFAERVSSVVRDIALQSRSGETTIAVTSAGVIAAIVQRILELPDGTTHTLFEVMKNCSITHILHTRERLSLSSFNDTTYLAAMRSDTDPEDLVTYL